MIINMSIRNLHRILILRSSEKSVHMHLDKSYSLMKTIFNKKISFSSSLSCLQTNLSVQFLDNAKFSTHCGDNMDGSGDQKPFTIYYEGLLQAQKDDSVLIIDVREQKEIDESGKLPGSIHIPMGNVTNMLNISDDQFKKEFEKSKPKKHTKIILSCRSGMRSATVQQELQKLGYENAYNYAGGWSEWESKQKK